MKVAIAADHAGMTIQGAVVEVVRSAGHDAVVLSDPLYGPDDDYPMFAKLVGNAIATSRAYSGVLICSSGSATTIPDFLHRLEDLSPQAEHPSTYLTPD